MLRHRNIGIDTLKVLACLAVVSLHFGCGGFGRRLAVPIFIFFSCYLYSCKGRPGSIIDKLLRLWIPFLVWGMFGLIVFCLIHKGLSWCDVAWQLTFGYPAAQHLYYLIDLIIITSAIWMIRRVASKTYADVALVVLLVVCVVFQYAGLNYKLLGELPLNMRYTLGRLAELFPCAIAGDMIGGARLIDRYPKGSCICAGLSFIVALFVFVVYRVMPDGFGYQGLLPLLMAIGICVMAIVSGDVISRWRVAQYMWPITSIGALTPGIYFMHDVVGKTICHLTKASHSNVLVLIVFAVSGILTWLLLRYRFSKWMISGRLR